MPSTPPSTPLPESTYSDHTRHRFSLRSLLLFLTFACLLVAVPGVALLSVTLASWVITAAVVVLFLVLLQVPAYFLLRRILDARQGPEEPGVTPAEQPVTAAKRIPHFSEDDPVSDAD